MRFYAGVEYRHLVVTSRRLGRRRVHATARPHGEAGDPSHRSGRREAHRADGRVAPDRGRGRGRRSSRSRLRSGCGARGSDRRCRRSRSASASPGRLTSAVDLVRGLGVLAGIEVLDVPGASAGFENDYGAQRDACLESLVDRDFFLLHVEATDEAGHQQNAAEKVAALESWDREIIGPLLEALPEFGPHRILLMPGPRHPDPARHAHLGSRPVPPVRLRGGRDGLCLHRDSHRRVGTASGTPSHGAPDRLARPSSVLRPPPMSSAREWCSWPRFWRSRVHRAHRSVMARTRPRDDNGPDGHDERGRDQRHRAGARGPAPRRVGARDLRCGARGDGHLVLRRDPGRRGQPHRGPDRATAGCYLRRPARRRERRSAPRSDVSRSCSGLRVRTSCHGSSTAAIGFSVECRRT